MKATLFSFRTAIDAYTFDKQKSPKRLADLVHAGYRKAIPLDPITRFSRSWRIIMEDNVTVVNQREPGIFGVRSASDTMARVTRNGERL